METRRLRLEGATLPELQARVLADHGDGARIVAAEQVTVGGIRGFFAKRHIEVTVEVPVEVFVPVPGAGRRAAHRRNELSTRLGIAALLDEADEAEARLHSGETRDNGGTGTGVPVGRGQAARPVEPVSTATPDFARLMDELTFATAPARVDSVPAASTSRVAAGTEAAAAARAATTAAITSAVAGVDAARDDADPADADPADADPADAIETSTAVWHRPTTALLPPTVLPPELTPGGPRLLSGPGDLVLLIGPQTDVRDAVRALASDPDAPIVIGIESLTDRRAVLAARAGGVERGRSVLVTCDVPHPAGIDPASTDPAGTDPAGAGLGLAARLGADQVWAVVHAGRKPEDTTRWVRAAAASEDLDAIAVLGADTTATPGTVLDLGLPIGWLVAAPAGPKNPILIG